MWKQWVNAFLGVVVLAAPFLGLSLATLTWTLAVAGIIIAVLAVWSVLEVTSGVGRASRLAHR